MTTIDTLRATPRLIGLRQLATIIGSHYQTLYGYCREGSIPHMRVNSRIKFDSVMIADWLEKRQVGSAA